LLKVDYIKEELLTTNNPSEIGSPKLHGAGTNYHE